MGTFSTSSLFGMTIRESANDGSDFTNPDADYRRLFLGEDGQLHVKDSAGAVTDIGAGSGNVATDAIWDAAGDLAVGTGANTAAKITKGAAGTVPTAGASTLAYAYPPGYQLDRVEITAAVNVTATSEATAQVIVTSSSTTFDGTSEYCFEFWAPAIVAPAVAANDYMLLLLFDNTASTSASIGRIANVTAPDVTGNIRVSCIGRRFLTPSAGARVYSVRAIVNQGTGVVIAGLAGTGAYMPAYLRITKA